MAASDYTIELSEIAERVYRRLYEAAKVCLEAGDTTNSKVTTFNMVEEALDRLIPHDPFNPAMGLSGRVSGIYRMSKVRIRICYIGSSKLKRIQVPFISNTPRKAGDVNDPYLDRAFDVLGIRPPGRRS